MRMKQLRFSNQARNPLLRYLSTQRTKMPPNRPEDTAKPPPGINYDHFINDFSKLRQPSLIRELNKLYSLNKKDTVSLGGGLPHPGTFPFKKLLIELNGDIDISLEGNALEAALQYTPTQGFTPLLDCLRDLQRKMHGPPNWHNTDVIVTPGSQDGIAKVIEMSLEAGEPIIVQHPVYSGVACAIKPFNADVIAIDQDDNGMRPDLLRAALQSRMKPIEGFVKSKGIPKLMYVNTTGANPTGVALSPERKKEIYQIACEYNLLILEDDPYYGIHFQEQYPISFLSMDIEGRVIRFDSFSKILCPGLRIGFVTGPKEIIRRVEFHLQASCLHASSLSQAIVHQVLIKWGHEGLYQRFSQLQKFYKGKRDAMLESAERHLSGLAEWYTPTAGMFLWIRVPGLHDVYHLVNDECMKRGVTFVTGHAFLASGDKTTQYLRACYTLPTIDEIDKGMSRLADAIRAELLTIPLRGLRGNLGT